MKTQKILSIFAAAMCYIVCATNLAAQEPDSALWESSSKYVFSSVAFPQKTADFTITVFDENGNPVPEDTPVALSIDKGSVKGATLFYSEPSGNENYGGGVFYFRTDSEGKLHAEYIPDFTPQPFSQFKTSYTDYEEDDIWELYDEQNRLRYYSFSSLVVEVNIPDPDDESSAYLVENIPLKHSSRVPVLIGPDQATIITKGKHGDEYIFSAEGVQPETAELELSFFDSRGNPLPEGVLVALDLQYGSVLSSRLIQVPETLTGGSYSPIDGINYYNIGGGKFFFKVGNSGKVMLTYEAPQMVPPPFSRWYKNSVISNWYTKEEAWDFYTQAEWEIDEGYSGPGFGVFSAILTVDGIFDGQYTGNQNIAIDSAASTLPALVGPDKIQFITNSKNGDEYVFTSGLSSETAEVQIFVEDSRGKLVPAGTPIVLVIDKLPGIGRLINNQTFHASRTVNNNTGIYEEGISVFLRLGEDGTSTFSYQAPYVNVRPQTNFNNPDRTYDEVYRALGMFALPAYYGCGYPCQFPDQVGWFEMLSIDKVPLIEPVDGSKVPVLIGAEEAQITLKPSYLGGGEIHANIRAKIFDFRGLPVPSNTNVVISTTNGNVPDSPSVLRLTTGDNGDVFGQYLSDTRPIDQSKVSVPVTVGVPFDPANGASVSDSWPIGTATLTTEDGAVNSKTHRYGEYLLGFSISDAIQDLNPLKAYSSMKSFSDNASNLSIKYKKLLNNVAEGNATDSDFEEYQQAWGGVQSSFHQLIQDVPGTSITGPNLQGGQIFNSMINSGVRRALVNTAREQLIEKPLERAVLNHIEIKVNGSSSAQKIVYNQSSVISDAGPFYIDPGFKITSNLWSLPSGTGTFELFGLEFQLENADTLIKAMAFEAGDQAPVIEDILPVGISSFNTEEMGGHAKGLIEITEVDELQKTITGVALFIAYRHVDEINELLTDKKIGTSQDTLSWLDGSRVIFADSTVTDSTDFFFGATTSPHPLLENESVIIDKSYVIGSFGPDSAIQKIDFLKPGVLQIVDSTLSVDHTGFRYDNDAMAWETIPGFSIHDDTLKIPIETTSIIGLGSSANSTNEPPFLTSLADTTVEKGSVITRRLKFSDLETEELTVSAESDTSAAQILIEGDILTVTLEEDFLGTAKITVRVFDGINTSSTSFSVSVFFVNQPPFISSLSDTTVTAGSSITITVEATDPDGDNLEYSAVADTQAVQVSFDRAELTVVPDELFIGESKITVTVADGVDSASESFNIVVVEGTGLDEGMSGLPTKVGLSQNYPNPFNPSTVIKYQLPINSKVSLKVFDILGREVAALVDGRVEAGYHQVTFNGRNLASGMYIYRLKAGNKVITKKLTLIK